MIYISKSKTENIIKFHKKNFLERLHAKSFNVSAEVDKPFKAGVSGIFSLKRRESIQIAIKILKKEKNYFEKFSIPVKLGAYYNIEGELDYKELKNGRARNAAKKKFVKKLKDEEFFCDDLLIFHIKMNQLSDLTIIIKCKAENIKCFSEENFQNHTIFTPNTADPGILNRKVPIKAIIRIDSVDNENKIFMGSPLCIERRTLK